MENIIKYNLAQAFPKAEIWTEQIEEGFSRPAFLCSVLSLTIYKKSGTVICTMYHSRYIILPINRAAAKMKTSRTWL